jgi:hypothetical protein
VNGKPVEKAWQERSGNIDTNENREPARVFHAMHGIIQTGYSPNIEKIEIGVASEFWMFFTRSQKDRSYKVIVEIRSITPFLKAV